MSHLEADQEEGASVIADTAQSDLFEFAPVGYLIVDCRGHISDVNQTALRLLGMDRKHLLADGPFSVFVHPDDQDRWTAHTRYVVAHQQRHGLDLRLKRQDGSEFFARVECSPHFDDEHETERFLMVILDITDRVEAEVSMMKSEMQYRALFESIDEGYCIIEVIFDGSQEASDFRFLEINPSFAQQTGLGDVRGKRMRELIPEFEDYWFAMCGRVAITGQTERFQNRAEQLGRWYEGCAFRVGAPDQRQVAVLFNDITEHKLSEQLLKESEANLALLAHKLEQRVQQRTAELQESEERFRTLFENSPDACFLLDLDGGFVDGNKEMERQIGYTREELVRQNVFTSPIFPSPARQIARERIERLSRGEHPGPVEYSLVCKDGSSIDVEVTSLLLSIGGRPVLLSSSRDMTVRKEAEVALRESEERFRMVYEHAVIGVAIADRQTGCFVQCNPAFCALVGYAEHELKGLKVSELIHPQELQHHLHLVGQLRSGAVPYIETDSCYTHKKGHPVWVHVVVSFLPSEPGQPVRVMALVSDITERKHREKALHESEARYRKLFEAESDAIITFDNQTRKFVDVNDAAVALYGYTREEFLGMSYDALTMEPDASYLAIEDLLDGKISSVYNRLHRKKDGTIIPVDISGATFKWKGRTLVCGICRDISEQIDRENELRKNREELRHLASELSLAEQRERQRIATELHDGISQLLSSAYLRLDTLRQADFSEPTSNTLGRVCDIIDQTLKVTRSLTFELSCPLLKELGLAASLEQLCAAMTRDHGISFEYVGDMQPIPVLPDHKFVIFRAVRELLMNVLKHSEANHAQVKMECRDAKAIVVVQDDGRGFDASEAGMGFSPGGGFGLFSIGEYIRHTGGELEINSIPEGGTRATFFVPLEV